MKKLLFIILLLSGCGSLDYSNSIEVKEQVSITIPKITSRELSNGISLKFLQDKELPIVSGSIFFPGGTLMEDKGLMSAMGSMIREGGAGNYSADKLDSVLEKYSASISSGFGKEYGSISFSCLSSDIDKIFKIFSQVVLNPKFEEKRLEVWKGRVVDGIKRRKDNPNTISSIAFNQLIYSGTLAADPVLSNDIRNISRVSILKAHRKYIRPNKAYMLLTGDIEEWKANKLIDKYFSNWSSKQSDINKIPEIKPKARKGIYFIEEDIKQSTVRIGQLGPKRLDENHYNIKIFNPIFGFGGFGTRLTKRIREDKGWAYTAYGGVAPDVIPGKSFMYVQTDNKNVANAIEESYRVILDMQSQEVSQKEIKDKVKAIENSFVFNFDSSEKVLSREISKELQGYPESYYEEYLDNIRRVKVGDVKNVANTYWDTSKFIVLVVGNIKAYNLLKQRVSDEASLLYGLSINKLKFDEKALIKN